MTGNLMAIAAGWGGKTCTRGAIFIACARTTAATRLRVERQGTIMARAARKGGRRGNAARSTAALPQLPWRQVHNTYPAYEIVSPGDMDRIHDTSIRILSEAGIRVMSATVMDLFEAAGALVDRDTMTIRIDASLVDAALATVPSRFHMVARNPAKRIDLGRDSDEFRPGCRTAQRPRHRSADDVRTATTPTTSTSSSWPTISTRVTMIGNQVCAPMEMPREFSGTSIPIWPTSPTAISRSTALGDRARTSDGRASI